MSVTIAHLFKGKIVTQTSLLAPSPSRDDLRREAKQLRKELRSKDKEKEAKAEDSVESTYSMCFFAHTCVCWSKVCIVLVYQGGCVCPCLVQ